MRERETDCESERHLSIDVKTFLVPSFCLTFRHFFLKHLVKPYRLVSNEGKQSLPPVCREKQVNGVIVQFFGTCEVLVDDGAYGRGSVGEPHHLGLDSLLVESVHQPGHLQGTTAVK